MNRYLIIPLFGFFAQPGIAQTANGDGILHVRVGEKDLVGYQAKPIPQPKGGDAFKGSNFIHPLKTPSGFTVTEIQPSDHLHHFGLWWPWKYLVVEERKVLFWELQEGEGLIQTQEANATPEGFTATSLYLDLPAPGGPQPLLRETLLARTSGIVEHPARGYHLDLELTQETAIDKPVTVLKYRYSGFSLRGTPLWNKDTCTVLTSEGKDYDASNFTRAKWVRVEGQAGGDGSAGVLLMSHPDNFDHPERLRTWSRNMFDGAVFVNFNTVMDKSWVLEPGKRYTRNFRVFVYDGTLTSEEAEGLWKDYVRTTVAEESDEPAEDGSD